MWIVPSWILHYIEGEEIYVISLTASLDEGRTTAIVDNYPMEPAECDGNVIPDGNLLKHTPLCEPISPPPIETSKDEILSLVEKDSFSDLMWISLPQMSVDDIYKELLNLTPYHENGHVQEAMEF